MQGGRIVADWPGLSSANLLEGRDLKPTLVLDALVTAACAESFALEQDRISKVPFPYWAAPGKPVPRLLRS
ncbi:uncharacterized protein (DUF1501 family) [Variovorax paradoxus]